MRRLWFVLGLVLILSFGCPQVATGATDCSECPPCVCEGQECPTCKKCEVCPELPEEKALISTQMYDWGYVGSNPREVAFTFNLYNYGYSEAKDVGVRCFIYNMGTDSEPKEELILSVDEQVGNIASVSFQQEQVWGEAIEDISAYEYYIANCQPINCENCEILAMRIPEIADVTKESGPIGGVGFAEKARAIE